MKLTRHPRRLLSALALALGVSLAAALPAQAAKASQTQQYDVEILVFANTNPDDQGEQWPTDPGAPDLGAASELGAPDGPTQLGPQNYRLSADDGALKRSGRYHPILHLAWRQTAGPLDASHGVHIHGPGASDTVDGTVKLSVGRYLHLDLDLLYRPTSNPAADPGPTTANGPASGEAGSDTAGDGQSPVPLPAQWVSDPGVFRMQQHRRLRSREVQYFDQPHFGVLALVTPYTPPAPKPETPPDSAAGNAPDHGTSAPQGGQ
ncbi:MAG: CsiV family protein [Gammaproteobacteria bacterium]